MKYDRVQETFRFITPGLYLLALILVINFDTFIKDEKLLNAIANFSSIIIVLLPFVGFVVGYFIECIMTWVERLLYWVHVPRPSKIVLNGRNSLYVISDEARNKIANGANVDNKEANLYLQLAKQAIGGEDVVARGYHQSIMARHILGAQLLGCIYYLAFAGGWSWCNLLYTVLIVLVVGLFWYHQTCVYMKYLFAEYGEALPIINVE